MPAFLHDEMTDFIEMRDDVAPDERLSPTKQDEMAAALDGARGVRRTPCENIARKRSKTMAFRCTPEEHELIYEMAVWSGMSRQDYIIAKLADTQVEVRSSGSVQKALKDSMAKLVKGCTWQPPTAR